MSGLKANQTSRRAGLLLAAGLAMSASVSSAQPVEVKPEILLMIDGSARMEHKPGFEVGPTCSDSTVKEPVSGVSYSKSRLHMVQDALVGSRTSPFCIYGATSYEQEIERAGPDMTWVDDAPKRHRAMCGAGSDWKPCGHDSGELPVPVELTELAAGPGGFVYQHLKDVRFSFMSTESNAKGRALPAPSSAADGYSFGTEAIPVGALATNVMRTSYGHFATFANLGGRDETSPYGGLVRGRLTPKDGQMVEVLETDASVEEHNRVVMSRVRSIVPYGAAPLSALISDATVYFTEEKAADPLAQCRPRAAVLITQGTSGSYYEQSKAGVCAIEDNKPTREKNPVYIDVCRQPEGFPYKTSPQAARELKAKGIPLYVISLAPSGLSVASDIAAAGSPGLGPDGGAGYFEIPVKADADFEAAIRVALEQVYSSLKKGIQTKTRPLAVSPGPGDSDGNVLQWIITSQTQISGVTDTRSYGQVIEQRLGCEPADIDPSRPGLLAASAPRYFEKLLATQTTRRAVGEESPGRALPVLGASDKSLFDQTSGLGGYNASAESVAGRIGSELSLLGLKALFANGYFGSRGLPGGELPADPSQRRRQLGGILRGDLVAITPPKGSSQLPSYQAFVTAHAKRPTLVATGSDDGMVHIFRADNGLEVLAFWPEQSLTRMGVAGADGLLDTGDVALCRSLVPGNPACPSSVDDFQFRTYLVGSTGSGGRNLFGLDITKLGMNGLLDNLMAGTLGLANVFPLGSLWNLDYSEEAQLGLAVSRPVLTHVRVGDQIKAAVVAGCGQDSEVASRTVDNAAGEGRCVLVLDAQTGTVIQKITAPAMTRPMTGSPAVHPGAELGVAERAYLGDANGRLWRVDLTNPDKAKWKAEIAWPVANPQERDALYKLGGEVVGRPSIALNDAGQLVVVFGTAAMAAGGESFVVSLSDRQVVDAAGTVSMAAVRNWIIPLAANEFVSGAPVIREGVAFFTTIQTSLAASCVTATGRLFGVDYQKAYLDADGQLATFERQGKAVDAVPMLPLLDSDGQKALAIILPPGRVAYGLTMVATPSCTDGEGAATDILLNLADESHGASGTIDEDALQVETVGNHRIQAEALNTRIFSRSEMGNLSLGLNRDASGKVVPSMGAARVVPFPDVPSFWGVTFTE